MTRDLRRAAFVIVLLIGVIALLHARPIYEMVGPRIALMIYDLVVVASAFAGAGLAFLLWHSFGRGEILKWIWGSLTLGLFLWAIGEALWCHGQLLADAHLVYPSVADFAWIAGYIGVAIALFLRYRSLRMALNKGWPRVVLWVVVTLTTLAVAMATVAIITHSQAAGLLEGMVNLLYPIGDLAVAIGALLIALLLTGGALSLPWGLVAAGCFCVAISDLLYAFGISGGAYQLDPASGVNLLTFSVNVLYASSYLILVMGLYMQARVQRVI